MVDSGNKFRLKIFTSVLLGFLFIVEGFSFWNIFLWRPHWVLMAVYTLGLYQAAGISLSCIFFIGLCRDAYLGFPWGESCFIYIAALWIAQWQHKLLPETHLLYDWLGFTIVSILASLFQGVSLAFFQGKWLPLTTLLIPALLNSAVYPVAAWVSRQFYRPFARLIYPR